MIRLTRAQVREVDRRAIEQYHIPGIVLMENAARGAASIAFDMLEDLSPKRILILCGGGNNAGDGLAIARHLHNAGHGISIYLTVDPAEYRGDALINWCIIEKMSLTRVPRTVVDRLISGGEFDLIVDAVFGTGLSSAPKPPFRTIAEACALSRSPILAVDVPSGMDCDTGLPLDVCIRATRTATFVAEKVGFANPKSHEFTGRVDVVDIGCPRELIRQVSTIKVKTGTK